MSKENKRGLLYIVSAPSGAGKTTLVTHAIAELASTIPLERATTYTTRPRRSNEEDGIDYHFVSKEAFLEMKAEGKFLETSSYDDHFYGSPYEIMHKLATGHSIIAITDRDGAKSLMHAVDDAVSIWIKVKDLDTLRHRIEKRGEDSSGKTERRITIAQEEMQQEERQRLCTYHIVNEDFSRALAELVHIIREEQAKVAGE